MGQSLVKNYVHIIFSTKHRKPLIKAPFESELHAYIGGICRQLESPAVAVGGYFDHVHILCMLSKKLALMTLVQKVKVNSSKWIKTKDPSLENFYWQDGYGAFSVNPNQINGLIQYIKNQHIHHSKVQYEKEYLDFLIKYKMDYDERYLWD